MSYQVIYRFAINLCYLRSGGHGRAQQPHATDRAARADRWDSDVDELIALHENPDAFTNDQIVDIVIRFLAHVPNHVATAKKLVGFGPMEDIFEVGVLVEDAD